jgi:hypothetical protein
MIEASSDSPEDGGVFRLSRRWRRLQTLQKIEASSDSPEDRGVFRLSRRWRCLQTVLKREAAVYTLKRLYQSAELV